MSTDGSRTLTVLDTQPIEDNSSSTTSGEPSAIIATLRLRGGPHRHRQHVAWGEDVIDNEGCGKKSSKICCIYNKPRRFDESSDEESDSDSDSSCDGNHGTHRQLDRAQPSRSGGGAARMRHNDGSTIKAYEPNAYERNPGSKKGKRKLGS